MAVANPPAFQEAAACQQCGAGFSVFRRKHHCRACGRSFCNEHSSKTKALPQFGLTTPVRVCDECFVATPVQRSTSYNNANATSSGPQRALPNATPPSLSSNTVEDTDNVMDIADIAPRQATAISPPPPPINCTCHMPLCICPQEEDKQEEKQQREEERRKTVTVHKPSNNTVTPANAKPKPPASQHATAASSSSSNNNSSLPSLFFTGGTTVPVTEGRTDYEVSGEGAREAIKEKDLAGLQRLLTQASTQHKCTSCGVDEGEWGVDPNYKDRQGMSLLHVAAVFNYSVIALALIDAGADITSKNTQGETPLECAPATLSRLMQQHSSAAK
eukprot:jgi/Chlat1/2439/Chrsp17S08739